MPKPPKDLLQKQAAMTAFFEDFKPKVYKDTKKIPTIGHGINLKDPSNIQELKSMGYNIPALLKGSQQIKQKDSEKFLYKKLEDAYNTSVKMYPNFETLPSQAKHVIMDLNYNVGPTRLAKFPKFNEAIKSGDFQTAAKELKNSDYYKQTGRRSAAHVDTLSKLKPPPPPPAPRTPSVFDQIIGGWEAKLSQVPIVSDVLGFPSYVARLTDAPGGIYEPRGHEKGGWVYPTNTAFPIYAQGGSVTFSSGGEKHKVYIKESPTGMGKGVEGHVMVNHPTMDKGKWDTIDLTEKAGAKTVAQGVAATKKWHRENPEYGMGGWTGYPDHTMYSSGMERFDRVRDYTKYKKGGSVTWQIID